MANAKFPTSDQNRIAVPQSGLSQPTWRIALTADVTKNGFEGDDLAPLAAIWVYACPAKHEIPGSQCVRALPVCIGDGITYASVWLKNLAFEAGTPPGSAPPNMQIELRSSDYATSEGIASGVVTPELMTDTGLLIGANGMPLCNQIEVWGRLDPATPDGVVVRATLGLRIGAGGSGPLQISYGELVTSGLLVIGTVLGV